MRNGCETALYAIKFFTFGLGGPKPFISDQPPPISKIVWFYWILACRTWIWGLPCSPFF
jgi:hypothetical protein